MASSETINQFLSLCFGGSLQKVMRAITEDGTLLNASDKDGTTPLIMASMSGKIGVMRYLFDEMPPGQRSTMINTQTNKGNTALMEASNNGRVEAVTLLIENGADLNLQNNEGNSALIMACEYDHKKDVVKQLLKAGAHIDIENKMGNTSLIRAALNGNVDIVKMLLDYTSDIHKKNHDNKTAWDEAEERGFKEIMILIDDYERQRGFTPLMIACSRGQISNERKSALSFAIEKRHDDIVEMMIFAGAAASAEDRAALIKIPKWRKNRNLIATLIQTFEPTACHGGNLTVHENAFWAYIITETGDTFEREVHRFLENNSDRIHSLAYTPNKQNIRAIDYASKNYQNMIFEFLHFYKRYEIYDGEAEYKNYDTISMLGIDHTNDERTIVTMKFYSNKLLFTNELNIRQICDFDPEYVIPIYRSHDSDIDDFFREETIKRGFYPYCVIMPESERCLTDIISKEYIAAKDWIKIKLIAKEILECVSHIHSKGYIHGNIKCNKIQRHHDKIKLNGLNYAYQMNMKDTQIHKYSSAYIPPEMVYEYTDTTTSASTDMWAVGVCLFHLFTGESLWHSNDSGNINQNQLKSLYLWNDTLKNEKLNLITDDDARNLISQLLSKDVNVRPSAIAALRHPFFPRRAINFSHSMSMGGDLFNCDINTLKNVENENNTENSKNDDGSTNNSTNEVYRKDDIYIKAITDDNRVLLQGIHQLQGVVERLYVHMQKTPSDSTKINQAQGFGHIPGPTLPVPHIISENQHQHQHQHDHHNKHDHHHNTDHSNTELQLQPQYNLERQPSGKSMSLSLSANSITGEITIEHTHSAKWHPHNLPPIEIQELYTQDSKLTPLIRTKSMKSDTMLHILDELRRLIDRLLNDTSHLPLSFTPSHRKYSGGLIFPDHRKLSGNNSAVFNMDMNGGSSSSTHRKTSDGIIRKISTGSITSTDSNSSHRKTSNGGGITSEHVNTPNHRKSSNGSNGGFASDANATDSAHNTPTHRKSSAGGTLSVDGSTANNGGFEQFKQNSFRSSLISPKCDGVPPSWTPGASTTTTTAFDLSAISTSIVTATASGVEPGTPTTPRKILPIINLEDIKPGGRNHSSSSSIATKTPKNSK
eukprot:gene8379-17282_t